MRDGLIRSGVSAPRFYFFLQLHRVQKEVDHDDADPLRSGGAGLL